jgi:hypothetical protein
MNNKKEPARASRANSRLAAGLLAIAALSEALMGRCADVPSPRFPSAHITIDEWHTFSNEVTAVSDVRCRDIASNQYQCDSQLQSTIWIFTRPGHPAHPAVTRAILLSNGSMVRIDRSGHYAGSELAFRTWMNHFVDLDKKQLQDWIAVLRQ